MLTREQILERISALDFNAEQMGEIEDAAKACYNIARCKAKVTEFMNGLDANSTEEALASLAQRCFVQGYTDAAGDIANEVAAIIVASK